MPKQIHTPEEKDRMLVEIDQLREKKKLTLPAACAEYAKKIGKTAKSTHALYQYWKSAKRHESLGIRRPKQQPSGAQIDRLAAALQTAVPKPTDSNKDRTKISGNPGRRAMLNRLLSMNERIMQELLNESENEATNGSDIEGD